MVKWCWEGRQPIGVCVKPMGTMELELSPWGISEEQSRKLASEGPLLHPWRGVEGLGYFL